MAIYDNKSGVTLRDSQVPFAPGILPPRIEKYYMNPIRYRTNYRIVPAYGLLCILCIVLIVVLMETDSERFAPAGFLLMGIMAAATVWMLRSVPGTRKAELQAELARYDFDTGDMEDQTSYTFFDEDLEVTLDANGMSVGDKFYWYGHLTPELVTTNRFNRVWIAIRFGSDPIFSVFLPLTPELIHAVQTLPIPLVNSEMLDFLLTHKENVFRQIYNTGRFCVFDD